MMKDQNEIFETLKQTIRFHSKLNVETSNVLLGRPFGKENRDCLDYVLAKCKELGFRTKNANGYYGYAEYGHGDELVGIFCHLDVVPAGDRSNWNYEPYRLTVKDNMMYGRGVSDDKGPAIISLYAVKSLIDDGVLFNKRVRLFFGCNEETGSVGIARYAEHEEQPTYAISPDSDFPVCFGEKGACVTKASVTVPDDFGLINMHGGEAVNAVCEKVTLKLLNRDLLETACKYYKENHDFFDYSVHGRECKIVVTGKSAHASTPEEGINAVTRLFIALEEMGFTEDFITDYNQMFADYNGKGIGCGFEDQYGKFTWGVGKVETVGTTIKFGVDCRYPVTFDGDMVKEAILKNNEKSVYNFEVLHIVRPLFVPEDNPLVQICYNAYVDVTKDTENKPYTMGGGTYAKSIANCVSIGGALPGRDQKIHQADEQGSISDFFKEGEIIKEIVKRLLAL